jgi:hypothetical protein
MDKKSFLRSLIPIILAPLESSYMPNIPQGITGIGNDEKHYDYKKKKNRRRMATLSRRINRGN